MFESEFDQMQEPRESTPPQAPREFSPSRNLENLPLPQELRESSLPQEPREFSPPRNLENVPLPRYLENSLLPGT